MKNSFVLVARAVIRGLLLIIPIYLAMLLLLKGIKSLMGLVRPVALLLPDWFPGEIAVSLLLLIMICALVGAVVQTRTGRVARERLEKKFFERIPGYALIRGLTTNTFRRIIPTDPSSSASTFNTSSVRFGSCCSDGKHSTNRAHRS